MSKFGHAIATSAASNTEDSFFSIANNCRKQRQFCCECKVDFAAGVKLPHVSAAEKIALPLKKIMQRLALCSDNVINIRSSLDGISYGSNCQG